MRGFTASIMAAAAILFSCRASAQMPPSSLIAIPDSDAEFSVKLAALAEKSGDAADFFRLKLAEKKLKNHDTDRAMSLAARADCKAFVFWRDVVTAEAHLAKGDNQKVLDFLRKLPNRPRPDLSFGETFYANLYKRALLAARQAKISLGRDAGYEAAELAANFPLDADVASLSSNLSAEQKMVKLHALAFAYKYSLIKGAISPGEIISSDVSREKKCEALYDLGYGLRRADSAAADAVEAFEGILDQKCGRDLEARALYWIGMLGPAAQKNEKADEKLLNLARNFKGHRLHDDAYYLLYKHAGRRGLDSLAAEYRRELMKLPRGDMRDKLAFETAFPYYERKDYARAAEVLEPIVESGAADENFTQVLYWYARSLEKTGGKNGEKAMKVYRRIVSEYPYSFYAILAAERAGVPLDFPPLPVLKNKAPQHDDNFFRIIDELNGEGFHNAAKQVMDLAMNVNPAWEKSDEEFVARKYIESQNYRKALDMAARHFDSSVYGPVWPEEDPMFAAFFPAPFPEAVKRGYKLTNLPRGSIEGVMREESLFQPNVRSHAGAVGLMQLMPRTAQLVARAGAGGANAWDLTEPVNNVLLGSSYLLSMYEKFGEMPYAIMAYNAGPGNVNRFFRVLGRVELDEFIENIPIAETRGYVKRVMRSMKVYGQGGERKNKKKH